MDSVCTLAMKTDLGPFPPSLSSGYICTVRKLQNYQLAEVEKSRRDRAKQKWYILAEDESDPSVYRGGHAGVATGLATKIRACNFSDTKAAFGYIFIYSKHIKMFVSGFKVTVDIVWVQNFQSNQSKPMLLLHLRESSSYKNKVWNESKGLREAWTQRTSPGLVSIHPQVLSLNKAVRT